LNKIYLAGNVCINKNFYGTQKIQELTAIIMTSCAECDENDDSYKTCMDLKKLARNQDKTNENFDSRMETAESKIKSVQGGLREANFRIESIEKTFEENLKAQENETEQNFMETLNKIQRTLNDLQHDDIDKLEEEIDEIRTNDLLKLQQEVQELEENYKANVESWRSFTIRISLAFVVVITGAVVAVIVEGRKLWKMKGGRSWGEFSADVFEVQRRND
jgi:flagellar biosynthesis GTPase FlhF